MELTYALGPFRLDPSTGVVLHGGEPVPLGPRAVAVLATLVARADRYVTKDDILAAAWPGLVVEENSLAAQVSAIRRAFRIVPGADRWIETLPKRGYRFVGPVEAVAERRGEAKVLARCGRSVPHPISSVHRTRSRSRADRVASEHPATGHHRRCRWRRQDTARDGGCQDPFIALSRRCGVSRPRAHRRRSDDRRRRRVRVGCEARVLRTDPRRSPP